MLLKKKKNNNKKCFTIPENFQNTKNQKQFLEIQGLHFYVTLLSQSYAQHLQSASL